MLHNILTFELKLFFEKEESRGWAMLKIWKTRKVCTSKLWYGKRLRRW